MKDGAYWIFVLGLPAALIAVATVFGWRYRKAVTSAMARSGSGIALPPASAIPILRQSATLQVQKLGEEQLRSIGSAVQQAMDRARAVTRLASGCFLLAGAVFWSTMVALHVWVAPASWQKVLPLVIVFAALPGLIVLLNLVTRSLIRWAELAIAYCVAVVTTIAALSWDVGSTSELTVTAVLLAEIYASPAVAMLLLIQRRLRSLMMGIAPVLIFGVAGAALVAVGVNTSMLPADIAEFKDRPELRWSISLVIAFGAAAAPLSVWLFLRILRSDEKFGYVVALASVGILGLATDELLGPTYPLGPLLAAVPFGVLQCSLIWLAFKSFSGLDSRRWLPAQVLQFHICWLFLALYTLGVIEAQIDLVQSPARDIAYGLYAAFIIVYVVLLHGFLRRAWKSCRDIDPKRLLLLRVFGHIDKRERLLDALEDTWLRVGRVDLIAGADLAMRTLRSWTLECFLLRRIDTQFLKSEKDVKQRLAGLHSKLEGDLRFPVNEICCYSDAWQTAVMELGVTSDVVLLDLRGFTRQNSGCIFELSCVIWHVALERVVVLTDHTTDEAALDEIAQEAWAQLPRGSPNARAESPALLVLDFDGTAPTQRLSRALFRAAY